MRGVIYNFAVKAAALKSVRVRAVEQGVIRQCVIQTKVTGKPRIGNFVAPNGKAEIVSVIERNYAVIKNMTPFAAALNCFIGQAPAKNDL